MTLEDTQKQQTDPEREALIAEMLRDAEGHKTELPSELGREPVIHRGDTTLPAPMVVSKISSAGYVYVWDSRTYVKAPVLYYMLPQILRIRRQDGSYRWTTNDPGQLPKRGTYRCLLHKDDPSRKHYDELGFRTCPKNNIANPYQVTQHMKSKHRAEWAAIENETRERERIEDRELQKLLITTVAEKSAVTPKPVEISQEVSKTFKCANCDKEFKYHKTYRKHIKECI